MTSFKLNWRCYWFCFWEEQHLNIYLMNFEIQFAKMLFAILIVENSNDFTKINRNVAVKFGRWYLEILSVGIGPLAFFTSFSRFFFCPVSFFPGCPFYQLSPGYSVDWSGHISTPKPTVVRPWFMTFHIFHLIMNVWI